MENKLFLINYEGAHWCGGRSACVVLATDEVEAELEAVEFMDETMRELFSDEYQDDLEDGGRLDEDQAYTINSIEEFGPDHDQWKWFLDYDQRSNFYPCINFEFEDIVNVG